MQTPRVLQEIDSLPALSTRRPFGVTALTTSAATILAARDDADFRIEAMVISNVTGSAQTVTVHIVPDGDTAAAANAIAFQRSVAANDVLRLFDATNTGLVPPSSTVQALAGANAALNIWGHGVDYQGEFTT